VVAVQRSSIGKDIMLNIALSGNIGEMEKKRGGGPSCFECRSEKGPTHTGRRKKVSSVGLRKD